MSRFSKFRKSPELFFADSRSRWLRTIARHAAAPLVRQTAALALLEDPVDALVTSGIPVLEALADRVLRRAALHRTRVLAPVRGRVVSVIVPMLNAEHDILRCLRSLLEQTYTHMEVIVVDDASEDRSREVVGGISDPRVVLLANAERLGAARARNVGLRSATGDYIAFQDADDVSHPERIERQLAALVDADAAVCVCNARRERTDGTRVVVNGTRFTKGVISMLFPRRPVFEGLGYMMDLRVGEDSEYYERIKATFGEPSEVHLFQTLYRAGFRSDSLMFSHGHTSVGESGNVNYIVDPDIKRALDAALGRLGGIRERKISPFVDFR